MGATFIRDQLDPGLYVSGTTLANIELDTSLLESYVAKWDTAKLKGMGYILSIWSPPAAMKSGGSLDGGSLKSSSDSAFVGFITAVVRYLNSSSAGLPVAMSVANEPEIQTSYPSAQYSDSQWQNVIMMTRGSLSYAGYTGVTLLGPETSTYDSVSDFLGGSNFSTINGGYLSTAVGAFAWHTYGTCNYTTAQSFITSYPRNAWVTEFSKPVLQGSTDLAFAIDGMAALGAQLTMVSNNYWAWWYGFAVQSGTDSTTGDPGSLVMEFAKVHFLERHIAPHQRQWQPVDLSVPERYLRFREQRRHVDRGRGVQPHELGQVRHRHWLSDDLHETARLAR